MVRQQEAEFYWLRYIPPNGNLEGWRAELHVNIERRDKHPVHILARLEEDQKAGQQKPNPGGWYHFYLINFSRSLDELDYSFVGTLCLLLGNMFFVSKPFIIRVYFQIYVVFTDSLLNS